MRNTPLRSVLVLVAAASAATASGCGEDGASCGNAACGGDITPGRYKIATYCASGSGTIKSAACPAGITVAFGGLTISGTYTFNADKTFATEGTLSGTIEQTFPAACLTMRGITLTCAQLNQAVQAALSDPDSPFSTFTCSGSGSCNCIATFKPQPVSQSGTWSTSGTNLSLSPDSFSPPNVIPYCAMGSQVTLSQSTMDMSAMSEGLVGNLTSSMVLTRE